MPKKPQLPDRIETPINPPKKFDDSPNHLEYCPNCGYDNDKTRNWCPNCDTDLRTYNDDYIY